MNIRVHLHKCSPFCLTEVRRELITAFRILHSRCFSLSPYPLCLTYIVLSEEGLLIENSTCHFQCRPLLMAASQKLCHHGEMVTGDIFIQKETYTNDHISPSQTTQCTSEQISLPKIKFTDEMEYHKLRTATRQ